MSNAIGILIVVLMAMLILLGALYGGGAIVLLLIRELVRTIRWIFKPEKKKGGDGR